MTLHTYPNIDQGTPEWHDIRRGVVTASVVGKLVTVGAPDALSVACSDCGVSANEPCVSMAAKKTPTPIKTIHNVRSAIAAGRPPVYAVADNDTSRAVTTILAAERITGWTDETPMTSDMWRGVESEPFAREVYSEHYGRADEYGFMAYDTGGWRLGYSPDGVVGDDGLIEVKAPRTKTHVLTILADEVPAHYMPQLQAGLLVSGREWIDFVSYVSGMPLYRKRVEPDERWFDVITDACITFEQNAAQILADYERRVADMPPTERIDFNQVELKLA